MNWTTWGWYTSTLVRREQFQILIIKTFLKLSLNKSGVTKVSTQDIFIKVKDIDRPCLVNLAETLVRVSVILEATDGLGVHSVFLAVHLVLWPLFLDIV